MTNPPIASMSNELAWSGIALADKDRIAAFLLAQGYAAKDIGTHFATIVTRAATVRRSEISPRSSMRMSR